MSIRAYAKQTSFHRKPQGRNCVTFRSYTATFLCKSSILTTVTEIHLRTHTGTPTPLPRSRLQKAHRAGTSPRSDCLVIFRLIARQVLSEVPIRDRDDIERTRLASAPTATDHGAPHTAFLCGRHLGMWLAIFAPHYEQLSAEHNTTLAPLAPIPGITITLEGLLD
ncbi:hypothetical protein J6590_032591 [Homalodisca vitripennis]|nr:hypothetical protein J6590_032591 [Homalodisca vitripennis]